MRERLSRREWIQTLFGGLGSVGLAGMVGGQEAQAATIGHYTGPRTPGKAKHVIFLFMPGGPSHLDMFDPKPILAKYEGQRPSAVQGFRTERETGGILPSPFEFKKRGNSGIEVSELLPQLSTVVDEMCVIRSMYTFNPTHGPSRNLINSGSVLATRPTLGSWLSYGLGTESENLPAFVVLSSGSGSAGSLGRAGFLPAQHQGVALDNSQVEPEKMIRYLRNTQLDAKAQREQLDVLQLLNRDHRESWGADDFLEGRIQAMESAYRMQFEAMEVFDARKESEGIRAEYGTTPFANSCLLARRLVERGVRYIYVNHDPGTSVGGFPGWDDHKAITKSLEKRCPDVDQACAALIRDLKRRGLLDETLLVWGGEFGRTPVSEAGDGRDHDPFGYTMWLAGGGIKGGLAYGTTDELGFEAVENRVSIHDLHATILYTLGMDHEKLTYRYAGRDFRLTDVHGQVVKAIVA